jgi:hypothetical protein
MKKLLSSITLIAGVFLSGNVFAQAVPIPAQHPAAAAPDPNAPVMKFEHDTINYGSIPKGSDGFRIFKFTNAGKEPLIISEAHGSCGCTVPTYVHEPIAPGQESEIKVHYDTERPGGFIKTVTISYNNSTTPQKVVVIKGTILVPPTPPGGATAPSSPVAPTAPASSSTTAH